MKTVAAAVLGLVLAGPVWGASIRFNVDPNDPLRCEVTYNVTADTLNRARRNGKSVRMTVSRPYSVGGTTYLSRHYGPIYIQQSNRSSTVSCGRFQWNEEYYALIIEGANLRWYTIVHDEYRTPPDRPEPPEPEPPEPEPQNTYSLPLVIAADNAGLTGFVRVINRAAQAGDVQIRAMDDTGKRFGPVSLAIGVAEAINIDSRDLERGNASKGLTSGVGNGEGNWHLELTTALDIQPLAYIRTADGFVTAMHDVAPRAANNHVVNFFNPGTTAAEVTVTGRDDAGDDAPGGMVRLTLPARSARTLTAQALEAGGEGIDGSLGDGAGKWRLSVTSNAAIKVMSLLASPSGHLSNLSSAPVHEGGGDMTITLTPDPPDTIEDASRRDPTPIGIRDETLSLGDADVFRFVIETSGTLEITVTGAAQAQFQAFRRDGTPLPIRNGMVNVEAGDHVFVRVSAAPGAGSVGTGSYRLETRLIPDTTID